MPVGIALFVVISLILKLPVKLLGDNANEIFLFYYRMFRYALSSFVIIGIYPMLFKFSK